MWLKNIKRPPASLEVEYSPRNFLSTRGPRFLMNGGWLQTWFWDQYGHHKNDSLKEIQCSEIELGLKSLLCANKLSSFPDRIYIPMQCNCSSLECWPRTTDIKLTFFPSNHPQVFFLLNKRKEPWANVFRVMLILCKMRLRMAVKFLQDLSWDIVASFCRL